MRIDVLTLFPEMFQGVLGSSMLGRAAQGGILEFHLHNIRDWSTNKHHNADDYPFGGGAGMVMMAQPIWDCLDQVDPNHQALRIALLPRGEPLGVPMARELSKKEWLVLLCGHYEGVDERALAQMDMEVSIGDYVLTGGELPAMVMIDAISRKVSGVLGNDDSSEIETFYDNLLEYPQYTRPEVFDGERVPDVLMSGHHANIDKWRREKSLERTYDFRPDLLENANLTDKDLAYLEKYARSKENN